MTALYVEVIIQVKPVGVCNKIKLDSNSQCENKNAFCPNKVQNRDLYKRRGRSQS